MEGGLFHASTGWEHLLPPGLRQLRDPGVVCREVWDFLALTPMGCRMLAEMDVRARLLLLPGICGGGRFRAETVVTYGLSPRDSITFSSLREPVLCVQRALPLVCGGVWSPRNSPCRGWQGQRGCCPAPERGCCGPGPPTRPEKKAEKP